MAILQRLSSLRRDTRGNALAIGAATLPLMIAGAGLAIDSIQISLARRELQRAADSAALAGAYSVNQHVKLSSETDAAAAARRAANATTAATRDLAVNNDVTLSGTPIVQNAPTAGTFANNTEAVRVQLSANRTLSFLSFFDATPQAISVEATAAIVRDGSFCLLALEDGDAPGVTVGGNATIDVGCGISTNSTSATAITATGSSSVTATPIMAVGGVPSSSNFNGSTLIPYSAVQRDPFASLPVPAPTNCRDAPDSQPGSNHTISTSTSGYNAGDGSICFNGFSIKGTVNFNFTQPTIVYINGGVLDFGSQANVTATNVTFVLTSTEADNNPSSIARFDMDGGADVDITAPTSGAYDGVAIYEDRRAPLGRNTKLNGNTSQTINGALYFPRGYFEYNGGGNMAAQCIQLIARRLDFRGNGKVTNSCPTNGETQNFQATYVRLVG